MGTRFLLVTGKQSIESSELWPTWLNEFNQRSLTFKRVVIANEPSPQLIDSIVEQHRPFSAEFVIGIGGGSVLDAAQAGLGSVHALASPLGAYFPIPHGEVCGTLLAIATQVNIEALQERDPESIALSKYANIGRLMADSPDLNDLQARHGLLNILHDWTLHMKLPRLSQYGIDTDFFTKIITHCRGSSMKTNPLVLLDSEIKKILSFRL